MHHKNLVVIVVFCASLIAVTALPTKAQVWSNGYSYRRTITIDHTKVPNSDQTDFPVLVSGTYSDLATTGNGGSVTNSNGYDVIFASDAAGSTALPFEQESYNSSTGAIVYWVQLPTVSHTSDTVFYLFYGNASVTTDQSNKAGVWDSNYAAVWHLANGSTLSAEDSTSNGNNGTVTGATATAGQIDGGASLSGSSQYIDVGNGSSLGITGNAITLEAWLYTSESNPSQYERIVTKEMPSNANPYDAYSINRNAGNNTVGFSFSTGGAGTNVSVTAGSSLSLSAWNHVVGTYDGSHLRIYLNGALSNTASGSGNIISTTQDLVIGADTAAHQEYFNGILDEVRVSKAARSPDWIATEYANQSSPSTFFSVTSGEAGTITPPDISSLSPTLGAAGTSVTITGTSFGSTQGSSTVTFNGTPGSPSSWSDTSIVVSVPSGATTGPVLVSLGGIASNAVTFTVIPTPIITGMSSTSGPTGIPITITGTNFGTSEGTSTITFNGTAATATSWSTTSIETTVPTGTTSGSVIVTVNGVSSSGTTFTVTSGPGILGLSPSSGVAGTHVTITGENFGSTQGSSTISYAGTSVAPTSWGDASIVAAIPAGASSGAFVVTVAGQSSNSEDFTVTPLPTGWGDTDIGTVGVAGSASYTDSNGTFTVEGGGSGMWGSSPDETNFMYQPLDGDGTIIAHLVSLSGSSSNREAGVMIRETFSANSTEASALFQPSFGYTWFLDRPTTGASTSDQFFEGITLPTWMKLVRSGNSFSAYSSADGLNWTQIGSTATVTMATDVYIGLAVSSGASGSLATATFDHVELSSASAPDISSISPTTGASGTAVTISGSGFGVAQFGSLVQFNGVEAAISSWTDSSISALVPNPVTSGPVVVTVNGEASNGVTFTAVTAGTLSGTVASSASGNPPISGASVQLMQLGKILATGTSDGSGDYTFSAIPAGSYDVQASAVGYGTSLNSGVTVLPNATATLNVTLSSPGTISGTVTKSDGVTPISGATVLATVGDVSAPAATTDSSGNYSIVGLNPGSYTVNAFAAGYVAANESETVTTGTTTTANLSLPAQGSGTISYVYDALGRLVGVINPSGDTAVYTYDAVGNVTSISRQSSAQLSVIAFSPVSALAGSSVTIYGTGFSTTANQNTVQFNGVPATVTSASATKLVVTVPSGAGTGTVSVSTSAGSAASRSSFIFLNQ